VIAFTLFCFFKTNHDSLKWYAGITNIHYNELLRVTPLRPEFYNGLVFNGSSKALRKTNRALKRGLKLKASKIEGLSVDYRWIPVAKEAGFKEVLLPSNSKAKHLLSRCIHSQSGPKKMNSSGLYKILGRREGYLIISLNEDIDKLWTE